MSNKSDQNRPEMLVTYIAVQKLIINNVEAIPLSLIATAFSPFLYLSLLFLLSVWQIKKTKRQILVNL